MKRIYIVVDNEGKYLGYKNYCVAFAEVVGIEIINIEEALKVVPQNPGIVISAGEMGIEVATALLPILSNPKEYDFALMTDREVSGAHILNYFGKVIIVVPSFSAPKFAELCPEAQIITADLAPAPAREKMLGLVESFQSNNSEASKMISSAEIFGFIGGRVAIPGGWKEISTEIFEQTAQKFMEIANGKKVFLVLHGLRGLTYGNGKNFIAPSDAMCAKIKSLIEEEQVVSVLTAEEELLTGKRIPVLRVLRKQSDSKFYVDNTGASGYYFALSTAISKGADIRFSAEQMNITKEALVLGADLEKIIPFADDFGWSLTVVSNILTHEAIREAAAKNNPVQTLDEALLRYLG